MSKDKDDDLKEKSKMALEQMFSTENPKSSTEEKKNDSQIDEEEFNVKVTWYLSRKHSDFFKNLHALNTLKGMVKTKAELQNEILAFFIKHHKHLMEEK